MVGKAGDETVVPVAADTSGSSFAQPSYLDVFPIIVSSIVNGIEMSI